jgi:hypothetical protein
MRILLLGFFIKQYFLSSWLKPFWIPLRNCNHVRYSNKTFDSAWKRCHEHHWHFSFSCIPKPFRIRILIRILINSSFEHILIALSSGGPGGFNERNNRRLKISWHCPFKVIEWWTVSATLSAKLAKGSAHDDKWYQGHFWRFLTDRYRSHRIESYETALDR